jgi:predicted transcriptional regulator
MPKITETIEISEKEFKKMQVLMKELNLTIHEFINIAVKDAIQTECGTHMY